MIHLLNVLYLPVTEQGGMAGRLIYCSTGITGNIGPNSTGEHLDVKRLARGDFAYTALDEFVEVDDKDLGRSTSPRTCYHG